MKNLTVQPLNLSLFRKEKIGQTNYPIFDLILRLLDRPE
jgi:hypothetical protein